MSKRKWTDEQFIEAVRNSLSYVEVLRKLGLKVAGSSEWIGMPIALELHHINGIKDDLRIENLQILCPNCHAFTDNYIGKNIGMSAQEETFEVEAG